MIETRINAYRDAVVLTIKNAMPELKNCETQFGRFNVDDLDQTSFKTPSVRVAVLSAGVAPQAEKPDAPMKCGAFVVTDGRDRDKNAWAISEAIALLLGPSQLFGINKMSAPEKIQITPLVTGAIKSRGISIIAVTWDQTLRALGGDIFDENGYLLEELYINGELVE